jgi:hypothetical protein
MLKVEILGEVPFEEYVAALVSPPVELILPEPTLPAVSGESSPTQDSGDTEQQG